VILKLSAEISAEVVDRTVRKDIEIGRTFKFISQKIEKGQEKPESD